MPVNKKRAGQFWFGSVVEALAPNAETVDVEALARHAEAVDGAPC
jgi:hypothetical protein